MNTYFEIGITVKKNVFQQNVSANIIQNNSVFRFWPQ